MKLFTGEERRILLYLSGLAFIGLLVGEGRNYLKNASRSDDAERERILGAFQDASQRYLAGSDSSSIVLWAAGLVSPVNMNYADELGLQALSGIGPVLAKRIVEYREENGHFKTIQELEKVQGIGPSLLLRWEGLVTVMTDTMKEKGLSIE